VIGRSGDRVDPISASAHYESIVTFRLASEARGALGVKAVGALCGAEAVFYFAITPLRAEAAELPRSGAA
jgi:hypothetical protein